jgi:hypothetical protein
MELSFLPLTHEGTRVLVDRGFLAAMDDGAMLVNAGRGQIVDTDALVAELRAGRMRPALDVTARNHSLLQPSPMETTGDLIIRRQPGSSARSSEVTVAPSRVRDDPLCLPASDIFRTGKLLNATPEKACS